ncbi:MAG: lycopene beta-cyclase CrtY [Oligoflexus sp.]
MMAELEGKQDMETQVFDYDIALLGAGLANGLIALRVKQKLPHLRLILLERKHEIGASQTWSFHLNDLLLNGCETDLQWMADFNLTTWNRYEVKFPGLRRDLCGPYYALRGEAFAAYMKKNLAAELCLGQGVKGVEGSKVSLADGSTLTARLIIDGRGWADNGSMPCGYQKFYGQLVKLKHPHGRQNPLIMDADLPQREGFRFIYSLPFSVDTMLIEDTRYSLDASIDQAEFRQEIAAYAEHNAWHITHVLDEEMGALPIPLRSSWKPPSPSKNLIYSGLAAGHFHPVTGYSIANAIRFSKWVVAELEMPQNQWCTQRFHDYSMKHWQAGEFYRRLNNMLFLAASCEKRYLVLEKFYHHREPLISRFYAQRLTCLDRLRLLSGKAPVPLSRGISAFFRNIGVEHDIEKNRVFG